MDNPLPSLKPGLEAVEFEHEGKPMILLRDQEGITEQSLAVSLPGFLLATLLNGKNSVEDLRAAFTKNTGAVLSNTEIQNLVDQLNKAGLLQTPELEAKRKKVLTDYLASGVRKTHFAGAGYPDKPLDLAVYLGKFFQDAKGPKKEIPAQPLEKSPPLGLISPHIDLHRGGPAYAWAYQKLAQGPAPDTIVALGVAHISPNSPWVFTNKAYDTPYGLLPTNVELARELGGVLWYEPRADELTHRIEHSLEFQSLWLKYVWRDKTPSWVPILCSSFYSFASNATPSSIATVEDGIKKMGAVLRQRAERGEKILILMGIDLAHVGPRFGDEVELTSELRQKIEAEDRASLEFVLNGDADGFYLSAIKDDHWRKICGLSSLYTGVRLMKEMTGGKPLSSSLLTYGQADDPMGGVVSFASAVFSR